MRNNAKNEAPEEKAGTKRSNYIQVVVHKRSKTTQNYTCKTIMQNSGFSRLREVVVNERFQPKGFDWKNLDVLDREWYIREVKHHDYV